MSCAKIACGACCCICCMIVVLLITVGVFVMNLKVPSAGVKSVLMDRLNLSPGSLSIGTDAAIWINNPNGWPLSGSILSADADVFSFAKDDPAGERILVGKAQLPETVTIAANSNSTFDLVMNSDVQADKKLALSLRLTKDCVKILSGDRTTLIGVHLREAKISFLRKTVELANLDIFFNATIPCPEIGEEKAGVIKDEVHASEAAAVVV